MRETIRQAFFKSVPVLAGYIVLGIGFGILIRKAGYGVLWAASMSLFIYAGSMQYVGTGLITGGASILTTALTTAIGSPAVFLGICREQHAISNNRDRIHHDRALLCSIHGTGIIQELK